MEDIPDCGKNKWVCAAHYFYDRGELEQAAQSCECFAREVSGDELSLALLNAGRVRNEGGWKELARKHFESAISACWSCSFALEAREELSSLELSLGRAERALEVLSGREVGRGGSVTLAQALQSLGRWREAVDVLLEASDRFPALRGLAAVAPVMGVMDDAIDERRWQTAAGLVRLAARRRVLGEEWEESDRVNGFLFDASAHGRNDRYLKELVIAGVSDPKFGYIFVGEKEEKEGVKGGRYVVEETGNINGRYFVEETGKKHGRYVLGDNERRKRLKNVCFVVGQAHLHSVIKLSLPLMATLPRTQFRVILAALPGPRDGVTELLARSVDRMIWLQHDVDANVGTLRNESCDVAIFPELTLHGEIATLAMRGRIAPWQMTTTGHSVTSGMGGGRSSTFGDLASMIDFYVSLDDSENLDAVEHYSEQIVRLNAPHPQFLPPGPPAASFSGFAQNESSKCPQTRCELVRAWVHEAEHGIYCAGGGVSHGEGGRVCTFLPAQCRSIAHLVAMDAAVAVEQLSEGSCALSTGKNFINSARFDTPFQTAASHYLDLYFRTMSSPLPSSERIILFPGSADRIHPADDNTLYLEAARLYPNAVLAFFSPSVSAKAHTIARRLSRHILTVQDMQAATRLQFWPQVSHDTFLAMMHSQVDLIADPGPYGSCTSLVEAMAMGTPILAKPGNYLRGRFSVPLHLACPSCLLLVNTTSQFLAALNITRSKYPVSNAYPATLSSAALHEWSTFLLRLLRNPLPATPQATSPKTPATCPSPPVEVHLNHAILHHTQPQDIVCSALNWAAPFCAPVQSFPTCGPSCRKILFDLSKHPNTTATLTVLQPSLQPKYWILFQVTPENTISIRGSGCQYQ